jgi:hypothetical protein
MSSCRFSSWVASTLKHPTLQVTTETVLSPLSTVKRANLATVTVRYMVEEF